MSDVRERVGALRALRATLRLQPTAADAIMSRRG
jgi:hypothetical protein